MCDYSLEHVSSRPAMAGETLTVRKYEGYSKGFAGGDPDCVTCVKEGTKLTLLFADHSEYVTMVRLNGDSPYLHHDAVLGAKGSRPTLIQHLPVGLQAVVLGGFAIDDPDEGGRDSSKVLETLSLSQG